ncbi:hypothetical protein OAO01_07580 [Oligoflexia bacterium]|nr:hypothetical protein [Oligoflexia bacterium]
MSKNTSDNDPEAPEESASEDRGVDLGIAGLLTEKPKLDLKQHVAQLIANRSTPDGTGTEVDAELDIVNAETDPYKQLASKKDWRALSILCEQRLSLPGEEDLEARLWWVHSQIKTEGVPISILSAPLDSVTQAVLGNEVELKQEWGAIKYTEVSQFAAAVLSEAAEILVDHEEYLMGVSFLERAATKDATLLPQLSKVVSLAIEQQESIPDFKKDDEQLSALQDLYNLHKRNGGRGGVSNKDTASERSSEQEDARPKHLPKPGMLLALLQNKHAKPVLILLVLGVFVCAWNLWKNPFTSSPLHASEAAITPVSHPSTAKPLFERVAGLGRLDALLYDIDNAVSKNREAALKEREAELAKAAEESIFIVKPADSEASDSDSSDGDSSDEDASEGDASEGDASEGDATEASSEEVEASGELVVPPTDGSGNNGSGSVF